MRILLVLATDAEIKPLKEAAAPWNEFSNHWFVSHHFGFELHLIISNPGIHATAYTLTKAIFTHPPFDLAINAGICGSFKSEIKIGEVVQVSSDTFADFGVETPKGFVNAFESGLLPGNYFPFEEGWLKQNVTFSSISLNNLRKVRGITVNTVTGTAKNAKSLLYKYHADIETMEGAAFFYVCRSEKISCLQIRSVSNKIEDRDKDQWNIPLAISNLNHYLCTFLSELGHSFHQP
jgi:futalosine hydrolase